MRKIEAPYLSLDTIREKAPRTAIILFGGNGTRLRPLTEVSNKHLLPVYDKPLALHALQFLERSGFKNVIAVCSAQDMDPYANFLPRHSSLQISFVVQEIPQGTAHAIKLCENQVKSHEITTLWGDNLFEYAISQDKQGELGKNNGKLYLTRVKNPENYGVVMIEKGKIKQIIDKPKIPPSQIICTGLMQFTDKVFETIEEITPNSKGELDIMDAVRTYHQTKTLDHKFILGRWLDAGVSHESMFQAAQMVRTRGINKISA